MLSTKLGAVALTLTITFSASYGLNIPKVDGIIPGAFIVVLKHVGTSHAAFYSKLAEHNIASTPRLQLDHTLFSGTSFRLDQVDDYVATAELIEGLPMVKSIWPVRTIRGPQSILNQVLYADVNEQVQSLQRRQSIADKYVPHVMGLVDRLHEEGYTGQGIRIGIIDSGVDYNHPALGGGFGPGFKINFGADLVGDLYNGNNIPVPDADPMDCLGHGTHVSGIIGANANPYNFTGVAPGATLGMYKVFGCVDSTSNDVLIAAFNMAFEQGVDLISASIGGPSGWSEDPWAVATARIVAAGTLCILAAGNDGSTGMFNTSSAAIGDGVLAVGSIDSLTLPINLTVGKWSVSGDVEQTFTYVLGLGNDDLGFPDSTRALYATSIDASNPADACSPLPGDTPNLANSYVLIRRGTCTFATKARNAAAFGAQHIIFYNNAPSAPVSIQLVDTAATMMVTQELGTTWANLLASSRDVLVTTLPVTESDFVYSVINNTLTGGYMSVFTSWGPNYQVGITPVVSAPGGNILSTWPLALGGYAVQSGTSMATPYVAGIVAIMKQVYGPNLDPVSINGILASTAHPVDFNNGFNVTLDNLAPIVQQGGGLVDAYAAVHANSIILPSSISFNDTRHFLANASLVIRNLNSVQSQNYTFSFITALTSYILSDHSSVIPAQFPPNLDTTSASLTFPEQNIEVQPNDFAIVPINLLLPQGLDASLLPVYSGFIVIESKTGGETFTLPYAGFAADLTFDAQIMDTLDKFPWLTRSSDAFAAPVRPNTVFTIPHVIRQNASVPAIAIGLALGTAFLDVNLIPQGSQEYLGLGSIVGFPQTYVNGLNFGAFSWPGILNNGKFVPAGNYTLRVRVLRLLGDPTCPDDWELYETFPFVLQYESLD